MIRLRKGKEKCASLTGSFPRDTSEGKRHRTQKA